MTILPSGHLVLELDEGPLYSSLGLVGKAVGGGPKGG